MTTPTTTHHHPSGAAHRAPEPAGDYLVGTIHRVHADDDTHAVEQFEDIVADTNGPNLLRHLVCADDHPGVALSDHEALDTIAAGLAGNPEWTVSMLEDIAELIRRSGRSLAYTGDDDHWGPGAFLPH